MTRQEAAEILNKARKEAADRERLKQYTRDYVKRRGTTDTEIKQKND